MAAEAEAWCEFYRGDHTAMLVERRHRNAGMEIGGSGRVLRNHIFGRFLPG